MFKKKLKSYANVIKICFEFIILAIIDFFIELFSKDKMKNISKRKFLQLNEKDLMFITNPGRMGDVDGVTFVIKNNDKYIMYRISGLEFGKKTKKSILYKDIINQFPKYNETLKNVNYKDDLTSLQELDESSENNGYKYKYIDMGFGNTLCVDKTIYNEFLPYLIKYAKQNEDYGKEERMPLIYYKCWEKAFIEFKKDKEIKK